MGASPKVVLCFLLGAISLHQIEGMHVSMRPFWKGWPFSNGFRQRIGQGPSTFGLSILDDFNDVIWPFSSDLNQIHPRRDMQLPRGSWLKIEDEKNEKQFDLEEQQLQLKEDQLRKERQNLQARRKDHGRQEEQRRLQLEQKCMDEQKKLQQKVELRKEEEFRLAKVQQQQREKIEAQLRQQREAKLRLEQIRQQNELQKQERERREELRLREEKRQLEKQRLLLEKERQERIRRDEERMERQRAIEEREIRRRQQEEAHRQRQEEERIRRWRKEQDNQETSRRKSHQNNLPRSEFGKLNIPEGYNIEDITIQTGGNQAFIKGYHLCKCYEDCYEREFERRIQVPKNIDTRTITGSLHPNGVLSLQGVRYNQNIAPIDTSVDVEGIGLAPSDRKEDSCNGIGKKKYGFKLKKMNARTGEIFEDIEAMEDRQPTFETEVDEDGLTIEIEE